MGRNLFGLDIAGKINARFGKGRLALPPLTLTRRVLGTRSATNPAGGTAGTSTTHAAKGIQIGKSGLRKGTIVPEARDIVLIIGDSVTPYVQPDVNDLITINSEDFTIIDVDKDPDLATFICYVR
jgi:hypothetical protein